MSAHKYLLAELNNAGISAVFHVCNDIEELASIEWEESTSLEWETNFSIPTDVSFAQEWDNYFTNMEV